MSHQILSKLLTGKLIRTSGCMHLVTSSYRARESNIISGSTSNQDILLRSIKSAKETSDVLHYIDKHHSIMNQSHILQAFKVIFSLQKCEDTIMSNGEVLNSVEFHTLCNVLKSRIRSLELNDTVDVLKTLSYLGVPATSKLVSILLNIIASRVNELTLQQIVFLDFLVKDFKSTPIVEALRIALPVVFQANLPVKVDRDNMNQACFLLNYASKKGLPIECVDTLIDIIIRQRNKLDLEGAMSVIRSICDVKCTDESHRPLLHHALDIVLNHIDSSTFSDLDVILSKLTYKYSKDNYFFYHDEFVNSICRLVVERDSGFDEAIWTLKKLNKLGHGDTKLLDYLAIKMEEDLNKFIRPLILFTLVRGFAIADYKPQNWSSLEPILSRFIKDSFLDGMDLPWISFVRDLATLGVWPMYIINRIFKEAYLEKYMKRYSNVLDRLQMLYLYQEVVTLCSEELKTHPPKHMLNAVIDINGKNIVDYPLLPSLEQGLGGSMYVATGVYTKLGHFLHHVFILRKGGYPVPVIQPSESQNQVCVDDLRVSGEHTTVAVCYLPSSFYSTNSNRLKGHIRLQLDSMKALGLTVVSISSDSWESLLEHERIPYLMREINRSCNFENSLQAGS